MFNQAVNIEGQVQRHQWCDPAAKNQPGIVRLLCEQLKDDIQSRGPNEVVFVWIDESGDFDAFCQRQLAAFRQVASACFYTVSRSERLGRLTIRLPLPSEASSIK